MRFVVLFALWMSTFCWIRDFPVPYWYSGVLIFLLMMDVIDLASSVRLRMSQAQALDLLAQGTMNLPQIVSSLLRQSKTAQQREQLKQAFGLFVEFCNN